jgi:xylulokinase
MIADATGVTVERPATREAACLGAAELAMVAIGRFSGIEDAAKTLYQCEKRFSPDVSQADEWNAAFARYTALYRSLYG